MKKSNVVFLLMAISCLYFSCSSGIKENTSYDVVIYGGTASGIAAALQCTRIGKSVIVLEQTHRIGGLTTGGLGHADIGIKQSIGGIALEFHRNLKAYYDNHDNWVYQEKGEYRARGKNVAEPDDEGVWTFEPSVALHILHRMIEDQEIDIVYNQFLNRETGVKMKGNKIIYVTMLNGETYKGKMFIDATYEGDLMASAGVGYSTGREPNIRYGETLNGVQTREYAPTLTTERPGHNSKNHNFLNGVDPYIRRGDPSSGLLPFIDLSGPGSEENGDHRIQAYCFRMCLTDYPDNRIPFTKPEEYNELDYELLFRNFEAGYHLAPWRNMPMPNRKTDTNNKGGMSTDFIGQNYDYPEADYELRNKIIEEHLQYQKGLMWTLAYHPRTPEFVRKEVSAFGLCKDEFTETGGWPHQLYIREARRMVSDYVMTQHHCEGLVDVPDPVGLGSNSMDSHHTQRYITREGYVKNEGNVQANLNFPYPISYRSIIPRKEECSNLFVPVCLSSTHIAFGSIRMESVFMILGQSAALAASLAIDENISVQDVDYNKLKNLLIKFEQRLTP